MTKVLNLVAEGKLKMVMEPAGPFSFTEEGIKAAFRLQMSGHAHGKIVVDIAGENREWKERRKHIVWHIFLFDDGKGNKPGLPGAL